MRITFIVQRYYPAHLTGSELFVGKIIPYLQKRGCQVSVITSDTKTGRGWYLPDHRDKICPRFQKINQVSIYRQPVQWYRAAWWQAVKRLRKNMASDQPLDPLYYFGPYLANLSRSINHSRPDVVQAVAYPCSYLRQLTFLPSRPPLVLTPFYHSALFGETNPGLRRIMDSADKVMVMTNCEKDIMIRHGLDPARVAVIPLGIDPAEMAAADGAKFRAKHNLSDRFVVLFAGTKSRDKGTVTALQAVRQLSRRPSKHPISLVAIGNSLPEWSREIISEDRRFLVDLPYVPVAEKAGAFAAADVLCMPSRADSFGFAFLEAWLLRKPVIGAKIGATPEIVDDGQNGRLVPFGKVAELAEAITLFMENPHLAKNYGLAGYQKVISLYNWDRVADQLINIYKKVSGQAYVHR